MVEPIVNRNPPFLTSIGPLVLQYHPQRCAFLLAEIHSESPAFEFLQVGDCFLSVAGENFSDIGSAREQQQDRLAALSRRLLAPPSSLISVQVQRSVSQAPLDLCIPCLSVEHHFSVRLFGPTTSRIIHAGWIAKDGVYSGAFHRRYAVLARDSDLECSLIWREKQDGPTKGSVIVGPTRNCRVDAAERAPEGCVLPLPTDCWSGLLLEVPGRTIRIFCDSTAERNVWLHALTAAALGRFVTAAKYQSKIVRHRTAPDVEVAAAAADAAANETQTALAFASLQANVLQAFDPPQSDVLQSLLARLRFLEDNARAQNAVIEQLSAQLKRQQLCSALAFMGVISAGSGDRDAGYFTGEKEFNRTAPHLLEQALGAKYVAEQRSAAPPGDPWWLRTFELVSAKEFRPSPEECDVTLERLRAVASAANAHVKQHTTPQ